MRKSNAISEKYIKTKEVKVRKGITEKNKHRISRKNKQTINNMKT